MSWYAIIMIIGVIGVGGGWIVYAIWDYKQRQEEKTKPPVRSERLEKTHGELSDWAKKMAEFKSPAPPRKLPKDDTTKNR